MNSGKSVGRFAEWAEQSLAAAVPLPREYAGAKTQPWLAPAISRRTGLCPPLRVGHDAQGQAALLLVESLVHGLIGKSALTIKEAVEIVDIAAKQATEMAAEGGGAASVADASLAALNVISGSLRRDIGE